MREGRLQAVRTGKQYRIWVADLVAMTGKPISEPQPVRRTRHVEAYSVVEVDAVSPELSERVSNMLVGAGSSRDHSADHPMRVQVIYDAPRGRLKVILIGSIETTGALLRVIEALVGVDK